MRLLAEQSELSLPALLSQGRPASDALGEWRYDDHLSQEGRAYDGYYSQGGPRYDDVLKDGRGYNDLLSGDSPLSPKAADLPPGAPGGLDGVSRQEELVRFVRQELERLQLDKMQ